MAGNEGKEVRGGRERESERGMRRDQLGVHEGVDSVVLEPGHVGDLRACGAVLWVASEHRPQHLLHA